MRRLVLLLPWAVALVLLLTSAPLAGDVVPSQGESPAVEAARTAVQQAADNVREKAKLHLEAVDSVNDSGKQERITKTRAALDEAVKQQETARKAFADTQQGDGGTGAPKERAGEVVGREALDILDKWRKFQWPPETAHEQSSPAAGDTIIPWPEFIPEEIKEVKDRADLELVVCPVLKDGKVVMYRGVYYKKEYPRPSVMEFDYMPGVSWLIRKPGPPRTFILYDVYKWTRTEQKLGEDAHTTEVVVPPPPFIPREQSTKATSPTAPIIRDLPVFPRSTPIRKTTPATPTTVERPPTGQTPETPSRVTGTVVLNLKAHTTFGGPGTEPVIVFLEQPPPTTADNFVSSFGTKTYVPTVIPWTIGDSKGPNVTQIEPPTGEPPTGEPPTGTPPPPTGFTTLVTFSPFGFTFIHLGWGWAYTTVPGEIVFECADISEYQKHLNEANRLRDLANKAVIGGPGYWLRQAQAARSLAAGLEFELAQRSVPRETINQAKRVADEHEKLANELKERGVPDKPDPKQPNAKAIEKERAAAIKKIEDEAIDHLHQARDALRAL